MLSKYLPGCFKSRSHTLRFAVSCTFKYILTLQNFSHSYQFTEAEDRAYMHVVKRTSCHLNRLRPSPLRKSDGLKLIGGGVYFPGLCGHLHHLHFHIGKHCPMHLFSVL